MDLQQVKSNGDLARDPITGSLLNVNSLDYEKYVAGRSAKEVRNQQVITMEEDLANLKGEINEIKSLLKELVHGN